eukprot:1062848-Prorocentrum_lima.AAC.1
MLQPLDIPRGRRGRTGGSRRGEESRCGLGVWSAEAVERPEDNVPAGLRGGVLNSLGGVLKPLDL